jgi:hypothetical protein
LAHFRCTNDYLLYVEGQKYIAAGMAAEALERGFNWFLTVHLQKARVPFQAHVAVTKICKDIGDSIRRRCNLAPCHVWILENPIEKGLHVHVLLHVPDGIITGLKKITLRSIRSVNGHAYPKVVHWVKIQNLWGLIGYLLKGLNQLDCGRLERECRIAIPERGRGLQGAIHGKRMGRSNLLMKAARNRT